MKGGRTGRAAKRRKGKESMKIIEANTEEI